MSHYFARISFSWLKGEILSERPFLIYFFLRCQINVCLLVFSFKSQLSKMSQHSLCTSESTSFWTFTYLVCGFRPSVSLYTSELLAQGFQKDLWVFQYFFCFSLKRMSQISASISTVQKHLSQTISICKIQKDQKLLWFANPGVLICLPKIHSQKWHVGKGGFKW